ncbi:MAG: hypothetical protein ACI9HK_000997, partial [Pirellulaceae bacterium]
VWGAGVWGAGRLSPFCRRFGPTSIARYGEELVAIGFAAGKLTEIAANDTINRLRGGIFLSTSQLFY